MNCHQDLHDGLREDGAISCPFCNNQIAEYQTTEAESCCENPDVINDSGTRVCRFCGQVDGYEEAQDYVNFYDNMFKIRKKSIYQRKYHVENVIADTCSTERFQLSRKEIVIICSIIDKIGLLHHQVMDSRKRIMISVRFILRQVFMMMGLPHEKIKITKSRKTLSSYKRYWSSIIKLIGKDINKIINK